MGSRLLEAAERYATKFGFAVFPVRPGDKRPLTPHGCRDAKKDIGAIRTWWGRWPDASIGIATGSISGLIVVDTDVDDEKGINGVQSLNAWEREHGALPPTCMTLTGRGGNHLFFHYEGNDIGNRTSVLEGVDVRGEGGYVIAPPSVHQNGTEYIWEDTPDDTPPAELNDTVLALINTGKEPKQKDFVVPEKIESGARNDTLYRMACSMQAKGLPDSAIEAAVQEVNSTCCIVPLPHDEVSKLVGSAIRYAKGEMKVVKKDEWHEPNLAMRVDKDGIPTDQPVQSIANAEEAINYDPELFGRIYWNELAYAPYVYGSLPWRENRGWREWDDADDTNLKSYIEKKYRLNNAQKVMDALNNVIHKHPVNPIITMLETCRDNWDGNSYIEKLLPAFLGVEPTEYNTAVMSLFMQGAIRRAFHPGCKFDYMMVLVGEQGGGKSTFLRCLAMNDDWFNDNFSTFDTSRAIENLRGKWIAELAELQATKRAKDVETIKSFITSRVDVYRAPYERRTTQRPRRCVLAGTSNPVDFLTDATGNRRFLPVQCHKDNIAIDAAMDEDAAKKFIAQAWGEAMTIYEQNPKAPLILPKHLQEQAIKAQESYLEEDPRIGIIQQWLDTCHMPRICVLMLWREALGHEFEEPSRKVVNELHNIMRNNITGWDYLGKQMIGKYGVQRCYERSTKIIEEWKSVQE